MRTWLWVAKPTGGPSDLDPHLGLTEPHSFISPDSSLGDSSSAQTEAILMFSSGGQDKDGATSPKRRLGGSGTKGT